MGMFHAITGTVNRYGNQTWILNNMIGIACTYQGKIPNGSQGHFFLYPVIDDRTKTVWYYGFDTHDQYNRFIRFLKISGVGGKIAYTLAMIDESILTKARETINPEILQSIPGIGPKLAKKILVEIHTDADLNRVVGQNDSPLHKKITHHLIQLGYPKDRVRSVVNSYQYPLETETLHECFVRCINKLK